MAIQMRFYSKAQQDKAQQLVARADQWGEGVRKRDGLRFNVFASESTPGVYYQTHFGGLGCTCPGAQKSRRGVCFHMIACQIVTEQTQEQAARPSKRYEDLWQGDGSQLTDAF